MAINGTHWRLINGGHLHKAAEVEVVIAAKVELPNRGQPVRGM